MSYAASSELPFFRVTDGVRRYGLDELDRIKLAHDVESEDGEIVPAGAVGTIVTVYGKGEAFMVEFSAPFHALADVDSSAIASVDRFE